MKDKIIGGFFIAILFLILVAAYNGLTEKLKGTVSTDDIVQENGDHIEYKRGCEYLVSKQYRGNTYCHCGDCKNPIHRAHYGDSTWSVTTTGVMELKKSRPNNTYNSNVGNVRTLNIGN